MQGRLVRDVIGSFVWLRGGAGSSVANFDQHLGFSNRFMIWREKKYSDSVRYEWD